MAVRSGGEGVLCFKELVLDPYVRNIDNKYVQFRKKFFLEQERQPINTLKFNLFFKECYETSN
jgi:hypothetical protein